MKVSKNKVILWLGLQNILQIGLVYPFHLLAIIYFSIRVRIKVKTYLDMIIVLYIVAGYLSLLIGISLAMHDDYLSETSIGFIKSFLVFMTCIVYFGVTRVKLEEFTTNTMWLFGVTSICILLMYIYLASTNSFSLYQLRGKLAFFTGWPQRWAMLAIIAHFLFYNKYHYFNRKIDLIMAFVTFVIIILGGTRSAFLSLIIGHMVLGFFSKRDLFKLLIFAVITIAIVAQYWSEVSTAFRVMNTVQYLQEGEQANSSIGYRLVLLWPEMIKSLDGIRMLFGWGHLGVVNIPGIDFYSSESQYMDTLIRQGFFGLALYAAFMIVGIIYSYRLYKKDTNIENTWIWRASFIWQIAMAFHGVTVETTRYPLLGLYYFLFLGLVSIHYHRLKLAKH